ncbi:MAG: hypothetical protein ACI9N9_001969, partial [Enterobacterales bacterium]
ELGVQAEIDTRMTADDSLQQAIDVLNSVVQTETDTRMRADNGLQQAIDVIALKPGPHVDGFNAGDTLFWDGVQWQIVQAPTETSSVPLQLTLVDGIVSWNAVNGEPDAQRYAIGERGPSGGWVFHITDGGLHGIEMATQDAVSGYVPWGCSDLTILTDSSVGTGLANTLRINSQCDDRPIAASVAQNYTQNGFDGWYLPSKSELILMHNNLYQNGIGNGRPYWSSTQSEYDDAWKIAFNVGYDIRYPKENGQNVRAVRSF